MSRVREGSASAADLAHLREAIALSVSAVVHGNHPFGAVLVDADGVVVARAENTVLTERDVTGHAETNLVRLLGERTPEELAASTLVTSCEPCAMCTGAIYWAGIGRVVFGLPESALVELTGADAENPTLRLPCRQVLAAGQREVEVVGPLLIEEARAPHEGFWG